MAVIPPESAMDLARDPSRGLILRIQEVHESVLARTERSKARVRLAKILRIARMFESHFSE